MVIKIEAEKRIIGHIQHPFMIRPLSKLGLMGAFLKTDKRVPAKHSHLILFL